MKYEKLTQKEYLKLIQENKKSLIIATFQDKNNINNCYKEMENTLNGISQENLNECFKNQNFLKLISDNKKRMVFKDQNNKSIYGDLIGQYYTLNFKGFGFVLNIEIDEDLTRKNFKLYTIHLSFLSNEV